MAEKIFEVEREADGEVVMRIKPAKFMAMPELAQSHLRAARKESLLALRSLIDAAIEQVDKSAGKKRGKKREKIEVQ
jgi:hypothetical protein